MTRVLLPLLMFVGLASVLTTPAEARLFRRASRSTTNYYAPNYYAANNYTTYATENAATAGDAEADATATADAAATPVSQASYTTYADVSTAQGVANLMASYNRVGHFGGNPGYEGCGCGPTPEAAYAICCYSNSGMATVDVGYAQGANGMWYCCRRYQ